jgi:hypothetical protein
MKTITFGATAVVLYDDGLTLTRLADGLEIPAVAQDDAAYLTRAGELGYGTDVETMSREHELGHSILAHLLGLPESPTLRGVADSRFWPHWRAEEAAVLALQAYARAAGVNLVDVAEHISKQGA